MTDFEEVWAQKWAQSFGVNRSLEFELRYADPESAALPLPFLLCIFPDWLLLSFPFKGLGSITNTRYMSVTCRENTAKPLYKANEVTGNVTGLPPGILYDSRYRGF